MTIALGNVFHMPILYLLILIIVPTAAISVLVMIRFQRRLASSSGQTSKGPKIAISVKPSASPTSASKGPLPNKAGTPLPGKTNPLVKPPTPVPTTAAPKLEVKSEQIPEIKEIRDLLAKMQGQMELISEILLSSPAEKNDIRESSSALKKFKLAGIAEEKGPETETPSGTSPEKKVDAKSNQEGGPFVSKKGVFEELPKPALVAAPKPSPKIKIPASLIQEGVEDVPPLNQTLKEVNVSASSSQGSGVAELVQLKKELERIRERITTGT